MAPPRKFQAGSDDDAMPEATLAEKYAQNPDSYRKEIWVMKTIGGALKGAQYLGKLPIDAIHDLEQSLSEHFPEGGDLMCQLRDAEKGSVTAYQVVPVVRRNVERASPLATYAQPAMPMPAPMPMAAAPDFGAFLGAFQAQASAMAELKATLAQRAAPAPSSPESQNPMWMMASLMPMFMQAFGSKGDAYQDGYRAGLADGKRIMREAFEAKEDDSGSVGAFAGLLGALSQRSAVASSPPPSSQASPVPVQSASAPASTEEKPSSSSSQEESTHALLDFACAASRPPPSSWPGILALIAPGSDSAAVASELPTLCAWAGAQERWRWLSTEEGRAYVAAVVRALRGEALEAAA